MKQMSTISSRLIFAAAALMVMTAVATTAWGQTGALKLEENFSYTAGTLLSADGWTSFSGTGTNTQAVTVAGLTYAGYASSGIGLADTIVSTGDDESRTFASFPSGLTGGGTAVY